MVARGGCNCTGGVPPGHQGPAVESCPMQGNCLAKGVVHCASVTNMITEERAPSRRGTLATLATFSTKTRLATQSTSCRTGAPPTQSPGKSSPGRADTIQPPECVASVSRRNSSSCSPPTPPPSTSGARSSAVADTERESVLIRLESVFLIFHSGTESLSLFSLLTTDFGFGRIKL